MNVPENVDFEIDADDALFEAYLKEPQPCFLLRADLSPRQVFWLSQIYCVVDFQIDGKRRFGILTEIYKHGFSDFSIKAFDRTLEWFKGAENTEGNNVPENVDFEIDADDALFEAYLKEPQPCFLLRADLSPRRLFWLSQTYCVVDFQIDGKRRFGVLTKIYKHDFSNIFTEEAFDRTLEWFKEPENASSKTV